MDTPEWELCKKTLSELITSVYNYGTYAMRVIEPHKLRGDDNYELTEKETLGSHKCQQDIAIAAANYVNAIKQYNQSIDPKIDISVMLN